MLINIENKRITEIYLSIMSIGLLKCIEDGTIDYDDAMSLLYQPFNIEKLEDKYPELGQAIHLGAELEDVVSIVPEKLEKSIKEIENLNKELIAKNIKVLKKDNGENSPIYKMDE